MKKVLLIFGILLFLGVTLLIGGFIYANHYVQSPAFRDKLVAEISKATGGTVQIEAVSISLFRQVEFGGIKLSKEDKQIGARSYSTSTKKIEVSFNFWSLLRNELEITGLHLDSPDIKIVNSPAASTPPPAAEGRPPPAGAPDQAGRSMPSEPPPAAPSAPPVASTEPGLHLVIRKATVRNGRLDITLPNGKRALLEGFNLEAGFTDPSELPHFQGQASCDSVTFTGLPALLKLKAAYKFDKDTLVLQKVSAEAAGGALEADGQAKISGDQPFKFHVSGSKLDLKQLLGGQPELASALDGKANFNLNLEGNFQAPLEATGKGSAEVKEGRITTKPIQFLVFTYQIPELQTIQLAKCETDFAIASHKVQFERIEARSEHLRLDGTGWYDFVEDTIDLNLHPALSETAKNRLPGPVAIGFLQEPDGFYGVTFRAWGPAKKPEHDLATKFAAGAWENFLSTEIPQNIMNNTFDQLEGLIKGKDEGTGTSTNSAGGIGSIIDEILGDEKKPSAQEAPPAGSAAPPDGSTNTAPENPVEKLLDGLF